MSGSYDESDLRGKDEASGLAADPPNLESLRTKESAVVANIALQVSVACIFGCLLIYMVRALFTRKSKESSLSQNAAVNHLADTRKLHSNRNVRKNVVERRADRKSEAAKGSGGHGQGGKLRDAYTHPLLVATLKGHTEDICDADFSANGRYFLTSSQDRSIHIWSCGDFLNDEGRKEFKSSRLNLDYDHASLARFSPDSKAMLAAMSKDNVVRIFKLSKKLDGNWAPLQTLSELPTNSFGSIIGLDINCNGKYIMTAYTNTQICLWSVKGLLLSTIVTKLNNLTCAKVSPCGRFIAASGAGKEVKVWHVTFDKSSGEFQSVEGAFELTGHSDDIPVFSFSGDSTRMVSVSVDKTFRLYDINVDFKKKQDPPLLTASSWTKETVFPQRLHVALSNDSRCLIIASTSDILIISGLDGKLLCRIDQAFADIGEIGNVLLDSSCGFLCVTGGRIVRVFRNIPGYQVTALALQESLRFVSQDSVRIRLQQQLRDVQTLLDVCQQRYPRYTQMNA